MYILLITVWRTHIDQKMKWKSPGGYVWHIKKLWNCFLDKFFEFFVAKIYFIMKLVVLQPKVQINFIEIFICAKIKIETAIKSLAQILAPREGCCLWEYVICAKKKYLYIVLIYFRPLLVFVITLVHFKQNPQ